jgi:transposase-like protein
MPTNLLDNPIFTNETKAREWLEARVWPNGPVCPHCGNVDQHKITKLEGKAHRTGVYQCNEPECREQFTVTVKTVFERSKIPLTKWLAALFLMTASKKGVSAHQVHRMLKVSYKSTWFMMHRLREAMRTGGLEPMGGTGKTIEVDETYFGQNLIQPNATIDGRPFKHGRRRSPRGKRAVLALVERGGTARTFHIANADLETVAKIMNENISRETEIHTDESRIYKPVPYNFESHHTVMHSDKEYVRYEFSPHGDRWVHTNTVEGYFSIFKRGMKGVYQHCAEKHLHRYLAEFDFRYNHRSALGIEDIARAESLARGIVGKRLTYRRPHSA